MNMVSFLDWDSEFFSIKIGKVETQKLKLEDLLEIEKEKNREGYNLIYIFADRVNSFAQAWLEDKQIALFDQKLTYKKKITRSQIKSIPKIEKFSNVVTPELLGLALASGHKSRFYKDLRLSSQFTELYTLWIEKSVNKELADEILVSTHNAKLSGLITLKKKENEGFIGLIAVDKELRGGGIGKELLMAAENWFVENNCIDITVVTQQENIQACQFYERNGFNIYNSQYIFHY